MVRIKNVIWPHNVAGIEFFSTRCLFYVKMLPRAQKEIDSFTGIFS